MRDSPPRLTVVNICISASMVTCPGPESDGAQHRKHRVHAPQAPGGSVMRGVSLCPLIGPAASALNSWLPPTPSSGSTATARDQDAHAAHPLQKVRQMFTDRGSASSPDSTVEPVVVRPETASK